MRLEEGFKCYTRRLPSFVGLPMKQPRSLTNEGREFGSFGRIAPECKRQVERRHHHIVKSGAAENTLDPRRVAPTKLARLLRPQWRRAAAQDD